MRENPDRGPIFDTCDNLADSVRLHRPGLLFSPRDVMEYRTAACLVYCTLIFAVPVEASRPSMAASPRKRTNCRRVGMSALCHVWTAPSWQGFSSRLQAGRCSHVFGLFARHTRPLAIMPSADQVPE